jgi:hypothetical protein
MGNCHIQFYKKRPDKKGPLHATCHRQVTQGHIGFVNRLTLVNIALASLFYL